MKYIKKFDSNTQYNTFKQSEQYIKPNLSSCELETEVHFDNVDNPNDHILTFVAQRPNSTIALCCMAYDEDEGTFEEVTSNNFSIEYSLNNSAWDDYDLNNVMTLQNVGDDIKFRGINDSLYFEDKNDGHSEALVFKMTGKIKAKGDVTSLLNEVGGNVDLSESYFCFFGLFNGCKVLTKAPNLPSTILGKYCYESMFAGCTSLKVAPNLPSTTLADYCYHNMFANCTSLKTAPELTATTLPEECYSYMFYGCKSLTVAPELPATTLSFGCYSSMFARCTSLKSLPDLPATQLSQCCYLRMFEGCNSLTLSGSTYQLIAETASPACYASMFQNCTKLESTPFICLENISGVNGQECCSHMFEGCSSLNKVNGMPAYTMGQKCYEYMFKDCTSLILSQSTCDFTGSTTTANYCFSHMFDGIKQVNEINLNATTLSEGCYEYMFANTTTQTERLSSENPFNLPAQTLVTKCYGHMFENTIIHSIVAPFLTEPGSAYTENWLKGVPSQGFFAGNTGATWYDDFDCGPSTIPCTWFTNMHDNGGGSVVK